jgi:hypothetical protein
MSKEPKQVRTEIIIKATPEAVWNVLTDFSRYAEWNPFITSLKGSTTKGSKLVARMEPPDGSAMTFKPIVLVANTNKELRWLGHLLFPGVFDGEHIFELYENTDGTTTFVQREQFRGLLVPLFSKMLDTKTVAGFEMMNKKLKQRVEGPTSLKPENL